ncbi:MAG: zinc protease [Maribacter sp.]|jgi:zinc protease
MKFRFNFFFAFLVMAVAGLITACTPKTGTATKATEKPIESPTEKPSVEEAMVGVGESMPDWTKKDVPTDDRVRMGTLPNGMKYYIQKNAKPEQRAELRLAINAGAMQEDADQQGLAHFSEHMAFNGTENFSKSELVDYLESTGTKFGADLNAYTSFDETVYMLQVRTDSQEMLDKGMLIIQDWAGAITFDGTEIDKERGVIMGEHRSGLGADERMRNEWFPLIFKDSRYAERLPIGKPEIIQNAPYDVFTRFYKDWYRPDLMAVIVVGDVDVDAMEKEIKERFGTLKNPEKPREKIEYDVPMHKETLISIVTDKEASSTQVQIMYKHDPMKVNNMGDYRTRMVHSMYNRMLSTRLQELTKKADPPFLYGFSSYTNIVRTKDAYYGAAGVEPTGVLKGLEALLLENQRVLKHGFTSTELERTKKSVLNSIEKQYKESDKTPSRRLATRYVSNHLESSPMPSPKQTFELYEKFLPTITLAEVNMLATKWITDENRVVIVTGPEKEGITMPTKADIQRVLNEADSKEVAAYIDEVSSEPLLAKKFSPVAITSTNVVKEIGVTEMTLANGVKIILKPTTFKNDEIIMSAYSAGGHSLYSDEDFMSASQASTIVDQSGVSKFSDTELRKMLAGKTVGVSPYIGELSEGLNGSCSPKDFETMLQLVYLYFTEPRKDEAAMSSYMTQMKTQVSFMGANPQFYFFSEIFKEMTNNHPRKKIMPTVEDLDKVNLDRIMEIYKDRFADASDFTFVFTGNFEPNAIQDQLASYLGNLPSSNRKETWKDVNVVSPKVKIEKTLYKGETQKSFAYLGFSDEFDWDDAQARYDFRSMISVLNIKLRERLREDEGGVYGVQVQGDVERWPKEEYSILIFFNAEPGEVDNLVEITKEEIQKLIDNGVSDIDITKVSETQRQERVKGLKENRFWSGYLQSAYRNNLNPTRIQQVEYDKLVDNLNSDAVQTMAKKVLNLDKVAQFILKPEEKK